jgi:hypothetical protein
MRPEFRNHWGVMPMRRPLRGGETEEEGKEDGGGGGGGGGRHRGGYHMIPRSNFNGGDDYKPLVDTLLFELLPYWLAIREGGMHVMCLQSRPDGMDITGKSSIFERMAVQRFLLRKNGLGGTYEYMRRHLHKKLYAEQVIELNNGARDVDRPYLDTSRPHLLPIAVPPHSPRRVVGLRVRVRRAGGGPRPAGEGYGNHGTCVPRQDSELVVSHLVMYHTKVLMYCTLVLLARLTKVRR